MMLTFYIKMNNFAGLYKQKKRNKKEEGINKVANVCKLIGRLDSMLSSGRIELQQNSSLTLCPSGFFP